MIEHHIFVTITATPDTSLFTVMDVAGRINVVETFYRPLLEELSHKLPRSVVAESLFNGAAVIVRGPPDVLAALQAPGALLGPEQSTYVVAPDIQFYPTQE